MSRIDDLIADLCPDGVEFKPLGEIFDMRAGKFISANKISATRDESVPYPCYGGNGIRGYVKNNNQEGKHVLIGRQGALCGNVKRVNGRFFATEHAVVCDHKLEVDMDWAFHLLTAMNLNQYATKSAQPGLAVGTLEQVNAPLPPIEVQREIVKILDAFTTLEAELEAELEARQKQYQYYRDELLSFEGREDVLWMKLSDVTTFTNAKPHEKLVDASGDIALMTSKFVSTQGRSARFVKKEDVLTPAFIDDVALVMSDLPNGKALARAFFVDQNNRYAANQRVCLLRVKDICEVNPRFMYYVIDRNPQLLAYDSGVDQTHLKKEWILNVDFPVIPINEQVRIAEILDKFDALVNDISVGLPAEIAARRQQYAYYRDKLLSFKEAA